MNTVNRANLVKGIGIGMVMGAAAGMCMSPRKKTSNVIGKALKAAGELADNITEAVTR